MKKVLVFGSTGFIGSAISKHLLQENFDVSLVCRLGTNYPKNTGKVITFVNLYDCINDIDFQGFDIVISCIGLAHDRIKSSTKADIYSSNFYFPTLIYDYCIKAKVDKFICISSSYVYHSFSGGVNLKLKDFQSLRFDLKVKLLCEEKMLSMSTGKDVSLYILQLPQVYGIDAPGIFQKLRGFSNLFRFLPVPPSFIKRILVNIKNVSDIVSVISNSDFYYAGRLIVCDSHPYTWSEIVNFIKLNQSNKFLMIPIPAFVIRILFFFHIKPALFQEFILEDKDTQELLAWKPKHNLFS